MVHTWYIFYATVLHACRVADSPNRAGKTGHPGDKAFFQSRRENSRRSPAKAKAARHLGEYGLPPGRKAVPKIQNALTNTTPAARENARPAPLIDAHTGSVSAPRKVASAHPGAANVHSDERSQTER